MLFRSLSDENIKANEAEAFLNLIPRIEGKPFPDEPIKYLISKKKPSLIQNQTGFRNKLASVAQIGKNMILENISQFLSSGKHTIAQNYVKNAIEGKSSNFLIFDTLKPSTKTVESISESVEECIVFMVGGGTFYEYDTIMEYTGQKNLKKMVYGADYIYRGDEFLKELCKVMI